MSSGPLSSTAVSKLKTRNHQKWFSCCTIHLADIPNGFTWVPFHSLKQHCEEVPFKLHAHHLCCRPHEWKRVLSSARYYSTKCTSLYQNTKCYGHNNRNLRLDWQTCFIWRELQRDQHTVGHMSLTSILTGCNKTVSSHFLLLTGLKWHHRLLCPAETQNASSSKPRRK